MAQKCLYLSIKMRVSGILGMILVLWQVVDFESVEESEEYQVSQDEFTDSDLKKMGCN